MLLLLVRLAWKWPWRGEPCVLGKERSRNRQDRVLQNPRAATEPWARASPAGWRRVSAVCLLSSPCLPSPCASSSPERAFPLQGRVVLSTYTAVIPAPVVLILALHECLASRIVTSLFCSVRCPGCFWLPSKLPCKPGRMAEWRREGKQMLKYCKQTICCLKFHCSSRPVF